MKKIVSLIVFSWVLALSGIAGATPYTYVMGNNSWIDTSGTADPGLVMEATIDAGVSGLTFALNVGEANTFKFAVIGTDEDWINNDDLTPRTVTAYIDFSNPDITTSIGGTTVGFTGVLEFKQGWTLTWNDPVIVDFGVGGQFQMELSDASYSSILWQGPAGFDHVYATVTHLADPVSAQIPEPAGIVLLGLAFMGLAGVRRKIRT